MDKSRLHQTLQEFAAQPLDIQGVVLVSAQGQPLMPAIGINETSVLIMAGTMLHLAERVQDECQWQNVEQISLRSAEGYVTLIFCTEDVFLLVKTANIPAGFLDRDLKQTVRKLQAQIEGTETADLAVSITLMPDRKSPDSGSGTPNGTNLSPQLEPPFIRHCQQELAEYIGPIAAAVCQRILSRQPNLTGTQLIDALAKQIPSQQQALAFQQRLRSQNGFAPLA